MTNDEIIKQAVNRFLSWKLPKDFYPDGGISFNAVGNASTPHEYKREPVGTNLFHAGQAEAMFRHALEGLLEQPSDAQPAEVSKEVLAAMLKAYIETIVREESELRAPSVLGMRAAYAAARLHTGDDKDAVDALLEVEKYIAPWATHCDYRAESDLQKALGVIDAALQCAFSGVTEQAMTDTTAIKRVVEADEWIKVFLLMERLRNAIQANHQHHQEYDEYGGYVDSELCTQNTNALTAIDYATTTAKLEPEIAFWKIKKYPEGTTAMQKISMADTVHRIEEVRHLESLGFTFTAYAEVK